MYLLPQNIEVWVTNKDRVKVTHATVDMITVTLNLWKGHIAIEKCILDARIHVFSYQESIWKQLGLL